MGNSISYDPAHSQWADEDRFVKAATGRFLVSVGDHTRWMAFDGNIWQHQEAETAAIELARETVQQHHASITEDTTRAAYSRQRITLSYPRSLVRAAELRRELRKPTVEFDQEPHLLGCANGIIDLRTGSLITGRPELLVSRSTGIAYDPSASAPRWERFLTEVLPADDDVQAYLRQIAGYLLTGETNVQQMWILHGRGANGKTVLVRTLLDLLGDYGQQAPRSVLLGSERHGGPRTDITRLDGMRLVALTETDRSDAFSESRVKELTGGERVVARRLYAEEMEFVPQAKFILSTNTLPTVRGSDNGIWRRLVVIPFTQTFTNPDPMLIGALQAELPGILAWAVRGAQEFYAAGQSLTTPAAFRATSDEYRRAQDHLSQFIQACCILEPTVRATSDELRRAYKAWARDEGHTELDWQTGIAAGLRELGIQRERYGKSRQWCWTGIQIKSDLVPQPVLSAIAPPNEGRTPADPGRRTSNSRPPLGRR